ncbi:hypothetical protein NE236_07715 [Actinoallomurus purpureus]|uniref:hypothetical protein n=1 Tax=Actinoallomurus purpureus TaxID=478114 RepID=UPI002092CAB1|nr:hypothetical protein [Actinoallomurus purpureus]MCO6004864.1 hypothetical protein [Actinoallomurus purpureus]
MKHVVVGAGVVGLLSGGLVVASGGSAMAKSNLTLNAAHKVIHAGQTLHFAGVAGDDAGLRKARFCLQVRDPGRHWKQIGTCVKPYHVDGWSADFRFDTRLLAHGRYAFRAVGVGLRHRNHEIYGPSPSVRVTVR